MEKAQGQTLKELWKEEISPALAPWEDTCAHTAGLLWKAAGSLRRRRPELNKVNRFLQITVGKFWGKKFLLEQKGDKSYYILNIKCQNAFICITVCGDYISGCVRRSKLSLRKIMQHKGRAQMPWKFGDIFLLWVVFGALKYTSSTGSLALIMADFLWPSPHLTSQVPCTFYIYSQSLSQQHLFRWTS